MKYDWKATADALRELLKEGDVVLVKGRDTEKMDRVALALLGRDVRCRRKFCNLPWRCDGCPQL